MLVPGNFYVFAPLYDDEVNEEFYDVISRQNLGDDLDPRSGLCVVKGYDQLTNLAEVFVSHFADNVIQPNRFVPYGRSARLEGQPLPLEVRPINYFNEFSEYINFTNPQRFHVWMYRMELKPERLRNLITCGVLLAFETFHFFSDKQ
ncbi:hypothetical protein ROZALSC1DRAFT_25024 [Rozella allomycis CSF55]|uniref:Uncharacterized protein n=1 Tax=Rozella allomycis (strain CSF55) TaxID=988480 RepID=A0A4P9YBH8_ROZAC|nr:hypothetical protein ROZALSC1DRAFT_25024 [Rozella allomycis CSF55]